MKLRSLFIISTLFVSCGPDVASPDFGSEINSFRTLDAEANLSSREKTLLADMCSSFETKTRFYNSRLTDQLDADNNPTELVYMEQASTGCDEKVELVATSHGVRTVGSKLFYTRVTTSPLYPEVLDQDSTEFRELCAGAGTSESLSSSLVVGTRAKWFTVTDHNDSDCSDGAVDDGTVCLKIESGVRNESNDNYRIYQVELLKTTRKHPSLRGVIFARRSVSAEFCDDDEVSEKVQNVLGFEAPTPAATTTEN